MIAYQKLGARIYIVVFSGKPELTFFFKVLHLVNFEFKSYNKLNKSHQ